MTTTEADGGTGVLGLAGQVSSGDDKYLEVKAIGRPAT